MKESYCVPFMEFLEQSGDPYECWQEDGFWHDRMDAQLDHILVWGTLIGLGYLLNGGFVAYLQFISGRTFPEMERGFEILHCPRSQQACVKAR